MLTVPAGQHAVRVTLTGSTELHRLEAAQPGTLAAAMRTLMDRWKAVPRIGRDGDDDLWKQFRAAQDVFFTARTESDKARTSEETANQKLKEELLAEAERIARMPRVVRRLVGARERRWARDAAGYLAVSDPVAAAKQFGQRGELGARHLGVGAVEPSSAAGAAIPSPSVMLWIMKPTIRNEPSVSWPNANEVPIASPSPKLCSPMPTAISTASTQPSPVVA